MNQLKVTFVVLVMFIASYVYTIHSIYSHDETMVSETTQQDGKLNFCNQIGELSSAFMYNRQIDTPIDVVRKAYMLTNPSKKLIDIVEHSLAKAYEHPIVEDKENAIQSYGLTMLNSCLHAFTDETVEL